MPESYDFERFSNLFEVITERNQPFLEKCSDTKLLAVSNFPKATEEYRTLVKKIVDTPDGSLVEEEVCKEQLDTVRQTLRDEYLGSVFTEALFALRGAFVHEVLRPAVKEFLSKEGVALTQVKSHYNHTAKIDGLLEVIRFMQKLSKEQ